MPRSSAKTLAAIHQAGFDLFHKRGYARICMDDIAAAAGVTKRSLYYHYDSKDALVGGVLSQQIEQSLRTIQKWGHPPASSAKDFVDRVFDGLLLWAQSPTWTGSGFTRLSIELADLPGHPARHAGSRHKAEIENWVCKELARLDIQSAAQLSRALCVLIEGATVLTLIHADISYMENARQTALQLFE